MESFLASSNLSKKFGSVEALSGISLTVPKGTILGLVGPNGAGKSTFLKILLGLSRISSGEASVMGYDVRTESHLIRATAGYVPDKLPFAWDKVIDLVAACAYLNGFSLVESRNRACDVLETFNAYDYRMKRYRNLSDGMKKRVILSLASIHDPSVYFLDEPTSNLDFQGVQSVISLVTRQRTRGNSIIIASHKAKFIHRTCNKLAVLRKGRLTFFGDVDEFISSTCKGDVLIPNSSLNDTDIKPDITTKLDLKPLGRYTLVPQQHWDDFQKIVRKETEELRAKNEPRSLSYALAKYYALVAAG